MAALGSEPSAAGEVAESSRAWRFRVEAQFLLCSLILALLCLLLLYPLILLFLNSFVVSRLGDPPVVGLRNWHLALTETGLQQAVTNTLLVTLARQAIAIPIGIFLAWLLARSDLPGKNLIELMFWVAFFLPTLPVVLGWVLLLDPDFGVINQLLASLLALKTGPFNIYSFGGILWVHLATKTIVFKAILLAPAFRNMDASLEEASRVAGVSALGTVLRLVLPIMAPIILVVVVLSTINALEAFEIELILGGPIGFDVYSTKIYRLVSRENPERGAATVLSVLILASVAPLIILQHWISTRRQYTTLTGQYKGQVLSLGAWRWPAFVAVFGLGLLVAVLPVIFVLLGTLMRLFGFFDLTPIWTLDHWKRVLTDSIFIKSLRNTLLLGVGTALLGVSWYALIAYIVVRTKYAARGIVDFLSWLPTAVPGVILGLGFLWLFLGTAPLRPLYNTIFVLILASAINSMTLGVQLLKTNMLQLGRELEEASWVSGGTWFYTFRRVLVPIFAPALVASSLLTFVLATRNLSHIALLVTSETRPLSMLMLDYMEETRYEAAAVVGVVTVFITVGVAVLGRRFGLK